LVRALNGPAPASSLISRSDWVDGSVAPQQASYFLCKPPAEPAEVAARQRDAACPLKGQTLAASPRFGDAAKGVFARGAKAGWLRQRGNGTEGKSQARIQGNVGEDPAVGFPARTFGGWRDEASKPNRSLRVGAKLLRCPVKDFASLFARNR